MAQAIGTSELRLIVVDGPAIDLPSIEGGQPVTIGRSRAAGISLPHLSVSRRHATLRYDGSWRITDLGSTHGTDVNTIRLEPRDDTRIHDQDLLRIGPWTLQVLCGGEPPPPSEPVTPDGEAEPAGPPGGPDTRGTIFLRLRDERTAQRELSWRRFTDRYGPVVTAFARHAGLSDHDAQDVLQDVLLGFFKVSGGFEYDPTKGRFRGYLRRVTMNAIRARARRERGPRPLSLDLLDDVPASEQHWSAPWAWQLVKAALEDARARFEPRTWEAFELHGRRGVPAGEVAAQLGMSAESVRHAKMRVARAAREIITRLRWEEG